MGRVVTNVGRYVGNLQLGRINQLHPQIGTTGVFQFVQPVRKTRTHLPTAGGPFG